jgi:hypothetical protein
VSVFRFLLTPSRHKAVRYCALYAGFEPSWPAAALLVMSSRRQNHAPPAVRIYPYVYVLTDGTARELHLSERRYLETEFQGGDGAAPHIKSSYDERNGWGEISGYLERSLLPAGTSTHRAPAEDPLKPMSPAEHIAWLRSKGVEVIENSDGSFTMMGVVAKPHH